MRSDPTAQIKTSSASDCVNRSNTDGLSEVRRQIVPASRSSCIEGSVAEVGARFSVAHKMATRRFMRPFWPTSVHPVYSSAEHLDKELERYIQTRLRQQQQQQQPMTRDYRTMKTTTTTTTIACRQAARPSAVCSTAAHPDAATEPGLYIDAPGPTSTCTSELWDNSPTRNAISSRASAVPRAAKGDARHRSAPAGTPPARPPDWHTGFVLRLQ